MKQLLALFLIVTGLLLLMVKVTERTVYFEKGNQWVTSITHTATYTAPLQSNNHQTQRFKGFHFFKDLSDYTISLDKPCKWLSAFLFLLLGFLPFFRTIKRLYRYRYLYCHTRQYYIFALHKIVI